MWRSFWREDGRHEHTFTRKTANALGLASLEQRFLRVTTRLAAP